MRNLHRVEKAYTQKFKDELDLSARHALFTTECNKDGDFLDEEKKEMEYKLRKQQIIRD